MKLTPAEEFAARTVFHEITQRGYVLTDAQQRLYDRLMGKSDDEPDRGIRVVPPPASSDMVQILCYESVARSIEARLAPRVRFAPPVCFGDDEIPTYILQPED